MNYPITNYLDLYAYVSFVVCDCVLLVVRDALDFGRDVAFFRISNPTIYLFKNGIHEKTETTTTRTTTTKTTTTKYNTLTS